MRTGNLAVLMCWVNIAVIHATLADWPILINAWASTEAALTLCNNAINEPPSVVSTLRNNFELGAKIKI